ncbi:MULTISPECIES: GNAT family N-acetyltransferase [Vibrio]|uniref:Acyl-CoA N-acyltransferase n=1 Tax=Vibrio nigripulchritudo SOn1 TaxID=1238450 RepID=A0AAV2VZX9_9VIBR|nr:MULTISPECIES: GNAT family protein [Vibrio]UAB71637.1 GNAT family N-acetyltransferase [Vibrio sp. SCSIO 43132]CCO50065.1 putative Acyl-CoA N-acyltransferase [Vibrio nigripulchritudo SOn1]
MKKIGAMQDNLFTFPVLSYHDCEDLLRFERANRHWFESYIDGRPESFYCLKGVNLHIRECLRDYESMTMLPTLIKNGRGEILGRANLHGIDLKKGEAWVGYRIAERSTGQGLATLATQQLIRYATTYRGLTKLRAYAATGNVASQRVLLNNQFKQTGKVNDFTCINGNMIDCYEFCLELNRL